MKSGTRYISTRRCCAPTIATRRWLRCATEPRGASSARGQPDADYPARRNPDKRSTRPGAAEELLNYVPHAPTVPGGHIISLTAIPLKRGAVYRHADRGTNETRRSATCWLSTIPRQDADPRPTTDPVPRSSSIRRGIVPLPVFEHSAGASNVVCIPRLRPRSPGDVLNAAEPVAGDPSARPTLRTSATMEIDAGVRFGHAATSDVSLAHSLRCSGAGLAAIGARGVARDAKR
jgi:hypothetical protein